MHNGIKEKHIAPVDISEYPAIKEHLDSYYPKLKSRADQGDTPYNLRNCVYMDDFSKQKLVWTPVNSEYRFTILPEEVCVNNSLFMIVGNNIKTLCGLLNSKLYIFYFNLLLAGGCYAYGSREFFVNVPLFNQKTSEINDLDCLVTQILNVSEDSEEYKLLLDKIDSIIFSVYNISQEEVNFINKTINY